MVGLAVSVAIAFVFGGTDDAKFARELDDVGLGSIAPPNSAGMVVAANGNWIVAEWQPLSALEMQVSSNKWRRYDAEDAVWTALSQLENRADRDRVLIATGIDPATLAQIAERASRDQIRVVVGPPSLARDVLAPQPPIVARCPEQRMLVLSAPADESPWARALAALALLALAGLTSAAAWRASVRSAR